MRNRPPHKVLIMRDQLQALNDFQRLLGEISYLMFTNGVERLELKNLDKTLEGTNDLNSPREFSAKVERELALVEKKIGDANVDRVDPKFNCILVITPSRESPSRILMQREDIILGWIFLLHKQSKKLKTYVERISYLILKGKLHLQQLTGTDLAKTIVL